MLSIALSLATLSLVHANIRTSCTGSSMYAMTWDDGPSQYTSQLLEVLSSKNVKATFHLTTRHLMDPNVLAIIQQISSAGHLIGLKTEDDWDMLKMTDEEIRAGIVHQANAMASFVGYYPKFIRLPENGYDARVLRAVESTGAIVTSPNLETYDRYNDGSRTLNAVKLALSLIGKGQGSFVSIQHDGVQQSVAIAGRIIDQVRSAGYKFVTLDECMGLGDMSTNKEPLKDADVSHRHRLPQN